MSLADTFTIVTCLTASDCAASNCTTASCKSNNCFHRPAVCTASDACHAAYNCDHTTGQCSNPIVKDGAVCPSGTCMAGICIPPAPMITSPAHGAMIEQTKPTFAGTAHEGSSMMVLVDGNAIGSTAASASGQWTLTA